MDRTQHSHQPAHQSFSQQGWSSHASLPSSNLACLGEAERRGGGCGLGELEALEQSIPTARTEDPVTDRGKGREEYFNSIFYSYLLAALLMTKDVDIVL